MKNFNLNKKKYINLKKLKIIRYLQINCQRSKWKVENVYQIKQGISKPRINI